MIAWSHLALHLAENCVRMLLWHFCDSINNTKCDVNHMKAKLVCCPISDVQTAKAALMPALLTRLVRDNLGVAGPLRQVESNQCIVPNEMYLMLCIRYNVFVTFWLRIE